MLITNNYTYSPNFEAANRQQMKVWKQVNRIPTYVNASYDGYTGMKSHKFPTTSYLDIKNYPDITKQLYKLESEILQTLKDCREERFGYLKALWKLCQNLGTGEAWDSKFLPSFPGRGKKGQKQYALYNGEIVSGNDISNLLFGHICKFMGIPTRMAQLIARLDASGILEPFSKGKLPTLKLLRFKDTPSDQLAIARGMRDFDINKYQLK